MMLQINHLGRWSGSRKNMHCEFLRVPIISTESMFSLYPILNPHLKRFLSEYPFDLTLQEKASQHYYNQTSMNSVEEKLYYLGIQMAKLSGYLLPDKSPTAVIGMPRSGWAVASGVAAELDLPVYYSNQGKDLIPNKPILEPWLLDLKKTVIVADDILWGGRQKKVLKDILLDPIFLIPSIDRYNARKLHAPVITCLAPARGFENYLQYLFD